MNGNPKVIRKAAIITVLRVSLRNKHCPECNIPLKGNRPWICSFCKFEIYPDHLPPDLFELLKYIEGANPNEALEIKNKWMRKLNAR